MVSIIIDSSQCEAQSTLTIDGRVFGHVQGKRRTLVQIPQGPHDLCVLPTQDERSCDQAEAVRHAYVHDGWVLEVRCEPSSR